MDYQLKQHNRRVCKGHKNEWTSLFFKFRNIFSSIPMKKTLGTLKNKLLTLRRMEEGRWLILKWSAASEPLAWQSSYWCRQQGDESELWGRSAWRPSPQQPSAGEEEEEEAEEEEEEDEGSGQRGRWQWPVSEFEAASPPPPPFSSPPSGAAKAQRGCLQGVHLCTSEHFLLHTCTQRHTHISQVERQISL